METKEILQNAVITADNKIQCPICGKTNGMITGRETVRNYEIRCRGSRRGFEHYFVLNTECRNVETEEK